MWFSSGLFVAATHTPWRFATHCFSSEAPFTQIFPSSITRKPRFYHRKRLFLKTPAKVEISENAGCLFCSVKVLSCRFWGFWLACIMALSCRPYVCHSYNETLFMIYVRNVLQMQRLISARLFKLTQQLNTP